MDEQGEVDAVRKLNAILKKASDEAYSYGYLAGYIEGVLETQRRLVKEKAHEPGNKHPQYPA